MSQVFGSAKSVEKVEERAIWCADSTLNKSLGQLRTLLDDLDERLSPVLKRDDSTKPPTPPQRAFSERSLLDAFDSKTALVDELINHVIRLKEWLQI